VASARSTGTKNACAKRKAPDVPTFCEVSPPVARFLAEQGIEIISPGRRGITPVFMAPGWTRKVAIWTTEKLCHQSPMLVFLMVNDSVTNLRDEQKWVISALAPDLKGRWPVLSAAYMLGGRDAAWALVYDWLGMKEVRV
jgi:hypothetical protein